jgi:two-component system, cell cycle sensor histidine kinase and response regulator CckA
VATPPAPNWLARVDQALAGSDRAETRAALAALLSEIGNEQLQLRERTDLLSSASFEGLLIHADGKVIEVNDRLCEMHGYERHELLSGDILRMCVAPEDVPGVLAHMRDGFQGEYIVTGVRKDGSRFRSEVLSKQGHLGERPVRIGAIRDVTERERLEAERRGLEQQVQRAQRLDSLGVLAGGIAHDFNNLLAGVLGNAELLHDRATTEDDKEIAAAIIMAGQRAAALTRQMLAYAGQRDLGRREPVDLGELVRELRTLLAATLSKKAELELVLDAESLVMGDRVTLGQVVMNLLTNASDSLGDRPGRITVRVRRVSEVDARWDQAQGATVGPGRWLLVEVEDTGIGMDEPTRGRVFEPFFSTKERGHGLGLAACLGIVRAHGGAVLVESELGRGSRFSVLLPATEAAISVGAALPLQPTTRPCRVLLVDDEAIVRSQLRRALELRGYTVVEAADGRTALAALLPASEVAPPDDVVEVVILDMTMPDLDGAEVLRRLRAAGSRVPVVISSGYLDVAVERRLPRGEFQGFLAKPYGATELVSAIERARAAR